MDIQHSSRRFSSFKLVNVSEYTHVSFILDLFYDTNLLNPNDAEDWFGTLTHYYGYWSILADITEMAWIVSYIRPNAVKLQTCYKA